MKIIVVAGARPNFMKIAPIIEAFRPYKSIAPMLVHTGQHYDEKMSDLFFHELGIPEPDINLGVGSCSHAVQVAEIIVAFEKVCITEKPDAVLVVGDVNSTIACGLVAVKLGIKLIHVEAGLRSFDRNMPEEINRILTDTISDYLFVTEPSGLQNLSREGVADERVFYVGNVMIDTLIKNREKAESSSILEDLGAKPGEYVTMTMHRPSNVDTPETLEMMVDIIDHIQSDIPIYFPAHPRTRNNLEKYRFMDRVSSMENVHLLEPIGYLDFLKLNSNSRCVFTDSGGLQEETTAMRIPCITIRENTERPITCEMGTNQLVSLTPTDVLSAWNKVKAGAFDKCDVPPLWDGQAAKRIVTIIAEQLS